ncbi:hypothetical protein [Pseudomonas aeruginosa]|uniref:hypothetical protein n=1 Tax=Pseudomonas aeruginosa TaxID=287 RepID=UPI002B26BF4D|nr:hypothetical protein [Pseudomonas aeruginosa]MEA8592250.1 hypothetical protein [Pseudomonas aeruginosa]HBO5514522.1 hypothetical protein [Pseudomonas aeruginosa]
MTGLAIVLLGCILLIGMGIIATRLERLEEQWKRQNDLREADLRAQGIELKKEPA